MREKIFLAIITLYMAFLIIPIFMYISKLNISMVCIFTSISIFVLYPNSFFNKVSWAGLFYLAVLLLYYFAGKKLPGMGGGNNPDLVRLVMATAFILPNLAISFVMSSINTKRIYRYITISSLIILLLSFLSFTPLIINNNNILRLITVQGQDVYVDPRLPHYSLLHAYIMLLPVVLLGFKIRKDIVRWFFLFLAVYVFYVVVQSAITTSLIIAVIVIIIMLTYNPHSEVKSFFRALGIIMVGFLLVEFEVITSFLDNIVDFYENTAAEGKMRYFKSIIEGTQADTGNGIEAREGLHQISINSFMENPLFGGGKQGGHSCILDRLGAVGLVGFIPYLFFLYQVIVFTLGSFKERLSKITFLIVAFCAFMLLYQKGLFGQECWLFYIVLAPAILRYLEFYKAENNDQLYSGTRNIRH